MLAGAFLAGWLPRRCKLVVVLLVVPAARPLAKQVLWLMSVRCSARA